MIFKTNYVHVKEFGFTQDYTKTIQKESSVKDFRRCHGSDKQTISFKLQKGVDRIWRLIFPGQEFYQQYPSPSCFRICVYKIIVIRLL